MVFSNKSMFQKLLNRPYDLRKSNLSGACKDDLALVQRLGLLKSIEVHKGCVNTICWNDRGNLILSGSDDQHLIVTNGFNYNIEADYHTSHRANIFSAKFLPCTNDNQIVSCSGDGTVLHTDLNRRKETCNNKFTCHGGTTTYEVITIPDSPNIFMSCGEDGTVRWFDLRNKSSCYQPRCKEDILISCQRAIMAMAVSSMAPYQLAVACADSTVRIYDRRYLSIAPGEHLLAQPFCTFIAPQFGEQRHYRITSLDYDNYGRDMLVSYSSDYLYLFNVQQCATSTNNPCKSLSASNKFKTPRVKRGRSSPPPVRRLRLRGDWSDTGPNARPEGDSSTTVGLGQARPQLQATLMQRMTDVLSRMLNDPMTRAALSAGSEDAFEAEDHTQRAAETRDGGSGTMQDASGTSMEVDDGQSDVGSEEGYMSRASVSTSEPSTPSASTISSAENRSGSSTMGSSLHTHLATLRNLRQGFINQHGAEPSVSFRYSEQSTSSSTISLRARSCDSTNNRASNDSDRQNDTVDIDAPSTSYSHRERNMDVDVITEDESIEEPSREEENRDKSSNLYQAAVKRKYVGHRNARTMIKEATFWGDDYVMSGSDCGHVFIWDRHTTELKMLLEADKHVVNCVRPHPNLPILATSGIDHDIKLWSPCLEECGFDKDLATDLIMRNAIMLEETRDTITVPAAFMIRMLSCLNTIRNGGRTVRNRRLLPDEN